MLLLAGDEQAVAHGELPEHLLDDEVAVFELPRFVLDPESTPSRSLVARISAMCPGDFLKPRLTRSCVEYPLGSSGSEYPSVSNAPPPGLRISTSYPASVKVQYGWVSSAHQKPIGQPVVFETPGLAAIMRILFRWLAFVTFTLALIAPPLVAPCGPETTPT